MLCGQHGESRVENGLSRSQHGHNGTKEGLLLDQLFFLAWVDGDAVSLRNEQCGKIRNSSGTLLEQSDVADYLSELSNEYLGIDSNGKDDPDANKSPFRQLEKEHGVQVLLLSADLAVRELTKASMGDFSPLPFVLELFVVWFLLGSILLCSGVFGLRYSPLREVDGCITYDEFDEEKTSKTRAVLPIGVCGITCLAPLLMLLGLFFSFGAASGGFFGAALSFDDTTAEKVLDVDVDGETEKGAPVTFSSLMLFRLFFPMVLLWFW
ncbi:unnamed protein product, partial [Amoebophrya sp. A25]|eukprot:GSA25T00007202001.1